MSLFNAASGSNRRSFDTTPLHYNNNGTPQSSAAGDGSATYYDVLKGTGEFAAPPEFFERTLKPSHSSTRAYPWASKPDATTEQRGATLRPGMQSSVRGSERSGGPSSSVFTAQMRSALPSSVFRLPGVPVSEQGEGDEFGAFMVGGRALRKAGQVRLSKFDRKVSLV
ncbi:hypothetical protein FBU59_005643 [Linderina macrospora]|uniref:Uncharacterized protein n=1 Tax=Linderina macrospora TaxID=4868 RepID=A0ACC1J239_9FUNG|nr:hypothetical protein FBU59_005643 [Linderina macrospora]